MILKQILITFLCLNLAFPMESWAATSSSSSPLEGILTQHRDIISGVGSMELVSKHGKALADATFKLMNDPKNKKFLNTQEGMELQKHQKLLVNFLSVKDHFEKCVKDKDSKRKLQDRILQSSFQSMSVLDPAAIPCLSSAYSMNKSYLDFNNGVMKAMKTMVKPYFQTELTKQVMMNTAKSLLSFKQKFKPDFMSQGKLTQKELDELVNSVCVKKMGIGKNTYKTMDTCQKMDPSFKAKLSQSLIDFSKTQVSAQKMTPAMAMSSLNSSIDRLNSTLKKINLKKDSGFFYDSANLKDEETKKAFDTYITQYSLEVSQGAGALLLTSTIKDEAGGIKSLKSNDIVKNKKAAQFQFSPHKKVTLEDVQTSIKEVEKKMNEQVKETLKIAVASTRKKEVIVSDEDDISELVKINPFAAGQVLINEPQYAGLMCDTINKINEDDVNNDKRDKYFTIGSAVLGGALVLTGVGTVAGAYLLTGSLTAGVAAGTIGGTILGYSTLVSSTMEIANLTYRGKRGYDEYREMNRLESAFLTQNGDSESLVDAKNALIEFKEARLSAGISLASLGINFINMASVFSFFKNSKKVSPSELKAITKIFQYLSETSVGKKLQAISSLMGARAADKLDQFFLSLAKVGESSRLKFLELLKDTRLTPQKLKDVIESALDAAKNCTRL